MSGQGMRKVWWVPVLLLAAGCFGETELDPENDRLDTGLVASLYSGQADAVPLIRSDKMEMVPVGTRVEIVDDTQPDPENTHRKTMVTVREGPYQGKAGRVFRDNLRPLVGP